jgi:hypothetical protein
VISYIIATNDRKVLEENLLASLHLTGDDELIVMENPPSIAVAYNDGTAQAKNRIRCFVHSDVQILDMPALRNQLLTRCTAAVGMVGLIGSLDRAVPWWNARLGCGAVIDVRVGLLDFGRGGPCSYVDGLLLATVQDIEWDELYGGFHLYDYDACERMLRQGMPNFCLTGGGSMVRHNTTNSSDMSELNGWDAALRRFRRKWGIAA